MAFVLAGPVMAGKNAGAALIVHTNDTYTFTASTACTTPYALPASCEEAITRSDKSTGTVVWLLAAFDSTATPSVAGIYFGVDYDDSLSIEAWKFCGPAGTTEIPDTGWPYEGRGNSLAFPEPIEGQHLFPFYVFKIDGAGDSSYFSTGINPTGGYAAFIDDSFPPVTDEVTRFGTVRWYVIGENNCPASGEDSAAEDAEQDSGGSEQGQDQSESSGGAMDDPSGSEDLTFIELTTNATQFASEARALRSQYGLWILTGLSPDGLIAKASQAQRDALAADPRVALVTAETIPNLPDVTATDLESGDPGFAARVWNSMIGELPRDSTATTFVPSDSCFHADAIRSSPEESPEAQTSVYLLGDVGVSLIFVESDSTGACVDEHSPEDWTTREHNNAFRKITSGITSLAELATGGFPSFWFVDEGFDTVSVEPIHLPSSDGTWVKEAMAHFGFEAGNDLQRTRAFCNARRSGSDEHYDWWFVTYVIDDSCDAAVDPYTPGLFSDGYASLGSFYGPLIRLLYINGYELRNALDWVAFHETCHIFGAPDEAFPWIGGCEDLWGYLRVPNSNNVECADSSEALPCGMRRNLDWRLCQYTRAHLGWRDLDDPADGVDDPIDHHDSHMSMLVGAGDSLAPGDWVDIYGQGGVWCKRLVASDRAMDRGRMLWDGINFKGRPCSTGAFSWRRNGMEAYYPETLRVDAEAPEILDVGVNYGLGGVEDDDTLSFRFSDPDTHGGWVRATAMFEAGDTLGPRFGKVAIIQDEFMRETGTSSPPILRPFRIDEGVWAITLQVWDVGGGHSDEAHLTGVSSGVEDRRITEPEINLSLGRPNPSRDWVTWDLRLTSGKAVTLSVVGIDGRRVKSWVHKSLPSGITRIIWDGRNDWGHRVASGKYFLRVTDESSKSSCRSAIIVR